MHASSRAAEEEHDTTCSRFCWMRCGGCCCIAFGVMLIAIGGVAPVLIDSIIDHIPYELTIDLEIVDREVLEIRERRQATAEVVE